MRRKITTILSILTGVGILAGIVYYIGIDKVAKQITTLGWAGFGLLFLSWVFTFLFWSLSWKVILEGYEVQLPFQSAFGARISSFSVSYMTPSMYFGGEPVRALFAQKITEEPYSKIFATIATERITAALALMGFILLGAYQGTFSQLPSNTLIYLILLTLVFAGFLVLLIINFAKGYFWFSRIIGWLQAITSWEWLDKAESAVESLEQDIRKAFLDHLKRTLAAVALNLVATAFMFIRPQIFFYFAKGRIFSFSQLTIIFALMALLSSFLWITPGGLGIVEGGMIGIFALAGADPSDAVAYSFSIKAIELFFVGIGASWMAHYGILNLLLNPQQEPKSANDQ